MCLSDCLCQLHKVLLGLKKNPSAGLIQNCAVDKLSQSYEETVSFCGLLIKDINVCPDITEIELRSDIGDNLYIFEAHYQNRFSAPHSVKVTFRVTAETEESSLAGFGPEWNFQKVSDN